MAAGSAARATRSAASARCCGCAPTAATVSEEPGGFAAVPVRVQPRAARDEIVGDREGVLIVRLTAAPIEGRANQALCRLLASRLGVARTRVTVVRGPRSRSKVVRVDGLSSAEIARKLGVRRMDSP